MYVLAKLETSTRDYICIYIADDTEEIEEPNTEIKILSIDVDQEEANKQLIYWRMYLLGSA